jgi:hypothetical protein
MYYIDVLREACSRNLELEVHLCISSVYKTVPKFQVATSCFSFNPSNLNTSELPLIMEATKLTYIFESSVGKLKLQSF